MSRPLLRALTVLLLLPATASATTKVANTRANYLEWDELQVTGDKGASDLTVTLTEAADGTHPVTFSDPTHGVTAGKGCTAADARTVTCVVKERALMATLGGGADRLTVEAPSGVWQELQIDAGGGEDAVDTSAVPEIVPGRINNPSRIDGGTGADELTGGPAKEDFDSFSGDDVIHAGAGDDVLRGSGASRLYGEDGDDLLIGPPSARLDGGAGDDAFSGDGRFKPLCGEGSDIVFPVEGHTGPLLGDECENVGDDWSAHPVRQTKGAVTFDAACTEEYGHCHARLQLRWKGRVAVEKAFRARQEPVRVRLALPSDLRKALAKAPRVVTLTVHGWTYEGGDLDVERQDLSWRTRLSV